MEPYLGLTELLDQDLSACECFQTLPPELQTALRRRDSVSSFEELPTRRLRSFHGAEHFVAFE